MAGSWLEPLPLVWWGKYSGTALPGNTIWGSITVPVIDLLFGWFAMHEWYNFTQGVPMAGSWLEPSTLVWWGKYPGIVLCMVAIIAIFPSNSVPASVFELEPLTLVCWGKCSDTVLCMSGTTCHYLLHLCANDRVWTQALGPSLMRQVFCHSAMHVWNNMSFSSLMSQGQGLDSSSWP
jgi:hypothetical protein